MTCDRDHNARERICVLLARGPLTVEGIARSLHKSASNVQALLYRLHSDDVVRRIGRTYACGSYRWCLTGEPLKPAPLPINQMVRRNFDFAALATALAGWPGTPRRLPEGLAL